MPIKLGTVTKKLPYKKIYLGNQIKYLKKEWILKTGNYLPRMSSSTVLDKNNEYDDENIHISHFITYKNGEIVGTENPIGLTNMFDGDMNTYGGYKAFSSSDNVTNLYTIFQFKKRIIALDFSIGCYDSSGDYEGFEVLGSNDGTIYDSLLTVESTSSNKKTYSFNSGEIEYSYIKIVWSSGLDSRKILM